MVRDGRGGRFVSSVLRDPNKDKYEGWRSEWERLGKRRGVGPTRKISYVNLYSERNDF